MESKYDNGERHLEEINHVSIIESVDEVFDGATSLMTLDSVMYGSTVTALITGLPICGDLDIAVSNQEYMRLCQNFANSVKWVQTNGKRIAERRTSSNHENPYAISTASVSAKAENPYAKAKHLPISKSVVFKSLNDSCVQIVESKTMSGDRLEDALEVVRKVDFTFCGVAVDSFGRMLEVIPHAYDDCLQRVIRIQTYQPSIDPKNLERRLRKYIERGWGLTISVDQIMANLNKAKAEYAKTLVKKGATKKLKKPVCCFNVRQDTARGSGYILETKRAVRESIRLSSPICDTVRQISMIKYDIDVDSRINNEGYLIFWGTNKRMTGGIARHVAELVSNKLMPKHKINPDAIRKEDKQRSMSKMYSQKLIAKENKTKGYVSGGNVSYASYGSTSSTSSTNW